MQSYIDRENYHKFRGATMIFCCKIIEFLWGVLKFRRGTHGPLLLPPMLSKLQFGGTSNTSDYVG